MRRYERESRIQQLIGQIVSAQTITADDVATRYKITKASAKKLIAVAHERLAARADGINRAAEIGRAKSQCEEIYRLALEKRDLRNALGARAELTRLLALDVSDQQVSTIDEDEIARARMALESLGVTEMNLPLDELARQVVLYILANKRSGEIE